MNFKRIFKNFLLALCLAPISIQACQSSKNANYSKSVSPVSQRTTQESPREQMPSHSAELGQASVPREPDVPYVPTPQLVVDAMLDLAQIKKDDVLYDLGSGDGRIPITAAKKYGIRAIGIDIDPKRIEEARQNSRKAGVEDLVTFIQADLFDTDFKEASVVTLYLLPSINLKLRPKLLQELKPGTRLVSHSFDMGTWEADEVKVVDGKRIYLWVIPERATQ